MFSNEKKTKVNIDIDIKLCRTLLESFAKRQECLKTQTYQEFYKVYSEYCGSKQLDQKEISQMSFFDALAIHNLIVPISRPIKMYEIKNKLVA